MKCKHHTPEQIIRKLRAAEQLLNQGQSVADVCKTWRYRNPPTTVGSSSTAAVAQLVLREGARKASGGGKSCPFRLPIRMPVRRAGTSSAASTPWRVITTRSPRATAFSIFEKLVFASWTDACMPRLS